MEDFHAAHAHRVTQAYPPDNLDKQNFSSFSQTLWLNANEPRPPEVTHPHSVSRDSDPVYVWTKHPIIIRFL